MPPVLARLFRCKSEPKALHCRRSRNLENYVAGVASYRHVFARLAGPKRERGYNIDCQVVFEADPKNRFDRTAVAVKATVSGRHIGYLPKEMTGDFHAAMEAHGTTAAIAAGRIRGGWWRAEEGSEGAFGVKVFMKWPPEGEVR
ncbi:MAG: HIRAN domain-containing protein [Limimaricola soesokkakensis]|uniref:HIRAN domain-containing protein n=1 Tax=Limimaricola soesokkakensis TaxID=1343159 RepID=UPI00405A2FC3